MNRSFVRFFVMAVLALAATAVQQARAAALGVEDALQVQAVVRAQLAAFADDDADRAFATATPKVREAIGNPMRFLAMVRGAYPMVYRPVSVTFHKPEQEDDTVLQIVEVRDDEDKSWLALFVLERQEDASWAIGGCAVAENHWMAA
jgi:hypothetical protein